MFDQPLLNFKEHHSNLRDTSNTNNYFVIRQRDISIAYQRKAIKRSFLLRKWKISLPFQPGFFLQSGEEEEGGGWIGD